MIRNVTILGTGLIGASVGLALRMAGFAGEIHGWDPSEAALAEAFNAGALSARLSQSPADADVRLAPGVVLLAGPVLTTLDWMEKLAGRCGEDILITDVGSTKAEIARAGRRLYNQPGRARCLPGHPMAGKERGGAELAEAELFRGAVWLFTPLAESESEVEENWRALVTRFGARTMDLEAERHDELCAWVSHLPQMLSTALAALLEERFGDAPEVAAIGGRGLRETTRLGASPYSMWRDVAMTNTDRVAETLLALEQELAHLRENLRTPELRNEFTRANHFRERHDRRAAAGVASAKSGKATGEGSSR
jgi:prephenate dehydrogenase